MDEDGTQEKHGMAKRTGKRRVKEGLEGRRGVDGAGVTKGKGWEKDAPLDFKRWIRP